MKKLLIVACLLLSGCVADRVDSDYRGKDAGTLVFSEGNIGSTLISTLHYRKVGQSSGVTFGGDGIIYNNPNSIFGYTPDFSGHETGQVTIQHLEPGDYEIYTYQIDGTGMVTLSWFPNKTFSIPFTIKPNQTTYIGDFECVALMGRSPLGLKLLAGGYFVVTDQHDRDIEIARKKEPGLPPVTISVTDVSKLDAPGLRTMEVY